MKLDRLLGILTVLLQNNRVTAPYLAEKFEVSRRTIGRDIDSLCRAGIPVITMQGAGGGIYIAEGFKLDKSILTSDELTGIIAALKGMGSVTDQSQIERTLDKLGVNTNAVISLREPVVIDLAFPYKSSLTYKIEQIKRAIIETNLIEFDYHNKNGESRRKIEPYLVVFQWGEWYVLGYCTHREDWRLFRLGRLWELKTCDESYTPREIPPEKRDFTAHFLDDIKLVALFDHSEKYRLIESYGMESFAENEDGLLLEVGFTNRDYVVSWLLGFGDKVKVQEPQYIVDEIKCIAQRIALRY